MTARPHLTVLGMQGSGKSTLANVLSERSGLPHLDGELFLSDVAGGRTAHQVADGDGVAALHRLEAAAARQALAGSEPAILSLAGSVLDDPPTVNAIRSRSWLVVVLEADPALLVERVGVDDHRRPMDAVELAARWVERRAVAMSIADLLLDAALPVDDLAARVATTGWC